MDKKQTCIKIFKLPFFPGVEALTGEKIINDFRRHIHKSYIIGLIEQGRRMIFHAQGSTQLSAGEIFILHPEQVHTCTSIGQSEHSYKILSISPQTMQLITSQITKKDTLPFFNKICYRDRKLSAKMKKLFNVIENPGSDAQIECYLYALFTYLLGNFSNPSVSTAHAGEQTSAIKRVCDYICAHFMENISLNELADVACLSPFHLQREFKKTIGITPQEYLCDFRIHESKKRLINTEEIANIALQTGFFDQSHFSKTFKKRVGISPGKYSKINKIR